MSLSWSSSAHVFFINDDNVSDAEGIDDDETIDEDGTDERETQRWKAQGPVAVHAHEYND